MTQALRILLVDDHSLFRSGIRLLLQGEDGFEIVGEAADGLEAVKRARQLQPDLVLLDLNLPGFSGTEALRLIKQDLPECAVLMLTVSEEAEDLANALRAGAAGYLLKNIEAGELVGAIRKAVAGDSVVSATMTNKLVAQIRAEAGRGAANVRTDDAPLTVREREVAMCLARGDSNKEIARALSLAESTVKIHVQNILKKLQLTSRVQIAVYAVEHGLVAPSSGV